MDKNTPTNVIRITAWHSVGYSPSFIRCPNCERSVEKTWDKPEKCSFCNQKLLWN